MTFKEFMKEVGYNLLTTFWEDFSIADKYGIVGVKDTYRRAFNEWKDDYKFFREVYWSRNKDKKAWEKLMSECPSMTSKEFWNNEWEEFDKEEISTHWYFIVGKPESIIDELINLEIGDTNVFYPHIKENRPWDIEEMDWYDLREHANTMSDFIQKLYNYI